MLGQKPFVTMISCAGYAGAGAYTNIHVHESQAYQAASLWLL